MTYLFSILTYFAIIFSVIKFLKHLGIPLFENSNENEKRLWIGTGIVFFVSFLCVLYHTYEHVYYFWDMSFYWERTIQIDQMMESKPVLDVFKEVYSSITREDYTYLPPFLIAPLFHFLGYKFSTYILAIALICFVPALLMLIVTSKSVLKIAGYTKYDFAILLILILPYSYLPLLKGYYDIIGIPLCCLLILYILKAKFESVTFKQVLFLSCLIIVLLFTRRWYVFWVISYFISYSFAYSYRWLIDGSEKDYKKWKNLFLTFLLISVSTSILLFIFFADFIKKSLFTNYSDLYSAFSADRFESLTGILHHFGLLILLLSLWGLFESYRRKELRYFGIANLIQVILIFFMFTRVQDFGPHHYYLFIPFITIFSVLGCYGISDYLPNIRYKVALVLIVFINFMSYFNPGLGNITKDWLNVMGTYRWYYPTERKDLQAIDEITKDLNATLKDGDYVYILSSSHLFNDDIVRKSKLPETSMSVKGLLPTSHIDKRDGFPLYFFQAKYVLVPRSIQLHENRDGQQVVEYLHTQMTNDNLLKRFYKPLKTYLVGENNDIEVTLLEKKESLSYVSVMEIINNFKIKYPDHPILHYKNPLKATTFTTVGSNSLPSSIFWGENEQLFLYPDVKENSDINFNLGKQLKSLAFNVKSTDPNTVKNSCNKETDGEIFVTILQDGVETLKEYVTWRETKTIRLDVTNTENLIIRIDYGKNTNACDGFVMTDFIYN